MTLDRKRKQTVKGHFFFCVLADGILSFAIALCKLDQQDSAKRDQYRCEYVLACDTIIDIGKGRRFCPHIQIGAYEHGRGEQNRREREAE